MIAYLGDFKMMMVLAVVSIPLLLLIRRPPRTAAPGSASVEPAH
jgi:DHA2 family multidrug resistance protein